MQTEVTEQKVKIKVTPVENEEVITFNFGMLNYCEESRSERGSDKYCDFRGDYKLCEYEKYLITRYMYNYGKVLLKQCNESVMYIWLDMEVIEYLRSYTYSLFNRIPGISQYYIDKIERKINALPTIQKLIKAGLESKGSVTFTPSTLARIKGYRDILVQSLKGYVNCLGKYLEKNKGKALTKAFYMENLHRFFKISGIKEKPIIAIAEYMLLQQQNKVWCRFPEDAYTKIGPDIIAYGRTCKKELIEKYGDMLFVNYHARNFQKGASDRYVLNEFVYILCLREYFNEHDFYSKCMPELKKNDLTTNDFKYIPQVAYIKSILENALRTKQSGINILLYGAPGTGKTALSKALIQDLGAKGVEVSSITGVGASRFQIATNLDTDLDSNSVRINNFCLIRKIASTGSNNVILYDEAEDFFRRRNNVYQTKDVVNRFLEDNATPVIWTMNDIGLLEESYLRRFTYVLKVDALPQDVYLDMVNKFAKKYDVKLDEDTLNVYAQYKPSLGLIEKTIKNFLLSGQTDQEVLRTDVLDALQGENFGEDSLPALVTNKFSFNPDLLNTSINLKELTQQIKDNKRLDFSLLLYGVPGSSKTSFGRYLAKELGLKVVNKNYSDLASCYVGETEQNIARLFKEAEKDKACIILDEADVLLRDRTASRYSWEVSQTETLLTCMENYPYPFIMTTNLFENLDAAVMRRILYKVKHDYLTSDQVKIAFKHFFDMDIKEELHLSKLASGDFAVVKKQAEFQGKLKDKDWIIKQLTFEMNQKKDSISSPSIVL